MKIGEMGGQELLEQFMDIGLQVQKLAIYIVLDMKETKIVLV